MNFPKFLRKPFLQNIFGRLLLLEAEHEKYFIKMKNQLQDITEKHCQRQLPPLICKQTFRDTVA